MSLQSDIKADLGLFFQDLNRIVALADDTRVMPIDHYSRNITTASLFLITTSLFEDAIREMLKSYISLVIKEGCAYGDIPTEIISSHVKATADKLKMLDKENLISESELVSIARDLVFCAKKSSRFAPYSQDIVKNNYNINAEELKKICKNVGISDVLSKIAAMNNIQSYYSTSNLHMVKSFMSRDFENFRSERNRVAHYCSFKSGISEQIVHNYARFSRRVALNLALVLDRELCVYKQSIRARYAADAFDN